MGDWMEFDSINKKKRAESHNETEERDQVWKPPLQGIVNKNIDAFLNSQKSRAGWGAAARDWKGDVRCIWAWPEHLRAGSELEESLKIRQALVAARIKGWKAIEM
ncbi:hypothetical protein ACH5RR_024851 [Cinchona calisaya]|uniref:RNase H type-1 domain-containing protein n=1 Tax=Cinchona calisaya TaxID=153742 RepID=A0ABD2YZ16_9GENT